MDRARLLLAAATAAFLLGLFSPEIYDTDFWWHLRTGQYIVETRSLPSPDPFAWTTAAARDIYPGESRTREFNLTHEWLAQASYVVLIVALYLVFSGHPEVGEPGAGVASVGYLLSMVLFAVVALPVLKRAR